MILYISKIIETKKFESTWVLIEKELEHLAFVTLSKPGFIPLEEVMYVFLGTYSSGSAYTTKNDLLKSSK